MATTLTNSTLAVALQATSTNAAGAGVASMSTTTNIRNTRANGTTAPAGNVCASYSGSVTSGTPVSLDLTASLIGPDGAVLFTRIYDLVIQNQSQTSGNDLLVGDTTGAVSHEWTAPFGSAAGTVLVQAGSASGQPVGVHAFSAPLGHTVDSTHKILTLTANAGTINFVIEATGVN